MGAMETWLDTGSGTAALFGAMLVVFALHVLSTAIGSLRLLVMTQGRDWLSAGLGFFEVLLATVIVALVIRDLGHPPTVLAYCLGYAAGISVGIRLEQHLSGGFVSIQATSPALSRDVADGLRDAGFGATVNRAEGLRGSVGVVGAVVRRREAREAMRIIREADGEAFVVLTEAEPIARDWMRIARHEA